MNLEELKKLWEEQSVVLERQVAINETLMRETLTRKIRSAFLLSQFVRAIEVALGISMIFVTMSVLSRHPLDARYLFVGGGLFVVTVCVTSLCAYALMQTASVHYGLPVLELQKKLESIRIAEYRAFKWSLLLGLLAWLPVVLFWFEAFTGVDALARVHTGWLVANLLFGLGCAGLGHLFSRKYLEGKDLSPWSRGVADSLSGYAIRSATQRLNELRSFESVQYPK